MKTDTLHDPDISLVAALWRFIENSGSTEEFFELRDRVRQHGALYDSAPALLEALEGICRHTMTNLADADDLTEIDSQCWDAALAAIAKARGNA